MDEGVGGVFWFTDGVFVFLFWEEKVFFDGNC